LEESNDFKDQDGDGKTTVSKTLRKKVSVLLSLTEETESEQVMGFHIAALNPQILMPKNYFVSKQEQYS
jgi:hypothetical protein